MSIVWMDSSSTTVPGITFLTSGTQMVLILVVPSHTYTYTPFMVISGAPFSLSSLSLSFVTSGGTMTFTPTSLTNYDNTFIFSDSRIALGGTLELRVVYVGSARNILLTRPNITAMALDENVRLVGSTPVGWFYDDFNRMDTTLNPTRRGSRDIFPFYDYNPDDTSIYGVSKYGTDANYWDILPRNYLHGTGTIVSSSLNLVSNSSSGLQIANFVSTSLSSGNLTLAARFSSIPIKYAVSYNLTYRNTSSFGAPHGPITVQTWFSDSFDTPLNLMDTRVVASGATASITNIVYPGDRYALFPSATNMMLLAQAPVGVADRIDQAFLTPFFGGDTFWTSELGVGQFVFLETPASFGSATNFSSGLIASITDNTHATLVASISTAYTASNFFAMAASPSNYPNNTTFSGATGNTSGWTDLLYNNAVLSTTTLAEFHSDDVVYFGTDSYESVDTGQIVNPPFGVLHAVGSLSPVDNYQSLPGGSRIIYFKNFPDSSSCYTMGSIINSAALGNCKAFGRADNLLQGINPTFTSFIQPNPEPIWVDPSINFIKVLNTGSFSTVDASMALSSNGEVYVWGGFSGSTFDSYRLARGIRWFSRTPLYISGLSNIIDIAIGGSSCIALDSSGNVWGWGQNIVGELGIGGPLGIDTAPIVLEPTIVMTGVSKIFGGVRTNGLLMNDGSFLIAGLTTMGLGLGTGVNQATTWTPITQVTGITRAWLAFNCSLFEIGGHIYGSGNSSGATNQIPSFPPSYDILPVPALADGGYTDIDIAQAHSFVGATITVIKSGQVYFCGYYDRNKGTQGDGAITGTGTANSPILLPILMPPGVTAARLTRHMPWQQNPSPATLTCGFIGYDGLLYKWGTNTNGQLGIGVADSLRHSTPTAVPGVSGVNWSTDGSLVSHYTLGPLPPQEFSAPQVFG